MLCGIRQRPLLLSLYEKVRNCYQEYQNDKDFLEVLRYRIDLTTKILLSVMSIYGSLSCVVIMYPVVYSMMYGEKLLIMSFYLPGVDPTSDMGHVIHNVVHCFLISLGAFGNFAGDMYVFILIIHAPLWKDILKIKCEKLNKVAVTATGRAKTMPMVKDVLLCHQNYNMYVFMYDLLSVAVHIHFALTFPSHY